MKTRLLSIVLLAATVGIASCRSTGQPPGPAPEPGPGAGTTAPPNPNPNPLPPPEPAPGPTPIASHGAAPSLAAAVPDQTAEPATAGARSYEEILRLKRAGASDEVLLNKVRADGVNYHLTTADVVELKAAGFSEAVLQAMLRSGQAASSR